VSSGHSPTPANRQLGSSDLLAPRAIFRAVGWRTYRRPQNFTRLTIPVTRRSECQPRISPCRAIRGARNGTSGVHRRTSGASAGTSFAVVDDATIHVTTPPSTSTPGYQPITVESPNGTGALQPRFLYS
jgi:hypothetical protein